MPEYSGTTQMNYMISYAVTISCVLLVCIIGLWRKGKGALKQAKGSLASTVERNKIGVYSTIEPLPEFRWEETQPIKFRPFKKNYHLTMALENMTASDLIEMDNTYVERIKLRRQLMKDHGDTILAINPRAKSAIDELYSWLLGTYLPTRYPTMFKLVSPDSLLNFVTGEMLPISTTSDPKEALTLLSANVDEDWLFLLPSLDGDSYVLEAFVTCFPNGFDPTKKLGLKLRDIHGPVPGYKVKLERSMDRFFDKIEVGRFVRRLNWGITTSDQIYAPAGNHLREGDDDTTKDIDISQTFQRSERQVLHRLPNTLALVFSFKTYMYPLSSIKAEGNGEILLQAIDGLEDGRSSVNGMGFYKALPKWRDGVKAYLRN